MLSTTLDMKDKNKIKRGNGPKLLLHGIDEAIVPSCRKHNFAQRSIMSEWSYIVGSRLASISIPISLNFSRYDDRGGVLICGLANASHTLLLQMQGGIIIERINTYFGYKAVDKIKFRMASLAFAKRHHHSSLSAKKVSLNEVESRQMLNEINHLEDLEVRSQMEKLARELFCHI